MKRTPPLLIPTRIVLTGRALTVDGAPPLSVVGMAAVASCSSVAATNVGLTTGGSLVFAKTSTLSLDTVVFLTLCPWCSRIIHTSESIYILSLVFYYLKKYAKLWTELGEYVSDFFTCPIYFSAEVLAFILIYFR
jgi:C4-dicarboxylate transporter